MSERLLQEQIEPNKDMNVQEISHHLDTNKFHQVNLQYASEKVSPEDSDIFCFDFSRIISEGKVKDWCLRQSQVLSLHKWRSEQEVKIRFHKCHEMPDEVLIGLVRLLKKNFANLISLQIIFVDCYETTSKAMEIFYELARDLPQLKKLDIQSFDSVFGWLSYKGVETMKFQLIRHLQNIESFSLSSGKNPEDRAIELLLLSISRYWKKLKYLKLDLSGSNVTNITVDLIARVVPKHLKNLQTFILNIAECSRFIDYQNLEHIPKILSFIPNFTLETK